MERPTNTAIHLLYRDANNYKTTSVQVFAGAPTPTLIDRLLAARDDDQYIVPEQVDLDHPAANDATFSLRFPDSDDDHGYVEIDAESILPTRSDPTDTRTFAEFVAACEQAFTEGWDPTISIEAHGGW